MPRMTFEEWCREYPHYCSRSIYNAVMGLANIPEVPLEVALKTTYGRFITRGVIIAKGRQFNTRRGTAQAFKIATKDAEVEIGMDSEIAKGLDIGYEIVVIAGKSKRGDSLWVYEVLESRSLRPQEPDPPDPLDPPQNGNHTNNSQAAPGSQADLIDAVLDAVRQVAERGQELEKEVFMRFLKMKNVSWDKVSNLIEVYTRDGKEFVRLKQ